MDKKIQFHPSRESLHSAYKHIVESPPEGHKPLHDNISKSSIKKSILMKILPKLNKYFKLNRFYNRIRPIPNFPDADLILSLGKIYRGNQPWILDILDHPTVVTGYDYKEFVKTKLNIEKILLASNCKAIICENEGSVEFMGRFFKEETMKKVNLVRAATKLLPEKKIIKRDMFKILFMGSLKNPKDFYFKGGMEAITAFLELSDKRNCELTLRCELPKDIYEKVINIPNIKILKDKISRKAMDELYLDSDILLLPSHAYTLMSTLEAMSASLPIIGLKTWVTDEFIKDGETGFLIDTSKELEEYYGSVEYPTNIKNIDFYNKLKTPDKRVIKDIVSRLEFLIKNRSFKNSMGEKARDLIKKKFSLKERNRKLKGIFDKATENHKL